MKIILKISLLLFGLFFISCENSNEPVKKTVVNSDYFPLAIGNKWYYKEWDRTKGQFVYPDNIRKIEEVKSTRYLSNKLFYLIERSYLNLDGSIRSKDSVYYNITGDTLYQILNFCPFSEESLSIRAIFADTGNVNFKMKAGDDIYDAYSRFETDTTMNFVYYRPNWIDSGSEWVFKKRVGICDFISYQTYGKKLVKYELY